MMGFNSHCDTIISSSMSHEVGTRFKVHVSPQIFSSLNALSLGGGSIVDRLENPSNGFDEIGTKPHGSTHFISQA